MTKSDQLKSLIEALPGNVELLRYATCEQLAVVSWVATNAVGIVAALTEAEKRDGWRPIESAPASNGSVAFLAHIIGHGSCVCYRSYSGGIYNNSSGKEIYRATHWQPLPAVPATAAKEE